MNIVWDEEKSKKLEAERGISLEEVAALILFRAVDFRNDMEGSVHESET